MPTGTAFRELAVRLADKVPLFRQAWNEDPEAAFFGGTVRDYLLWLAGKLDDGERRGAVEAVIRDLLARPVIDHREFLAADSDVDVFSSRGVPSLDASRLSVKRVDARPPSALDPTSAEFRTHRDQGFLPAEKIVLTRTDVRSLSPELGDGIEEIRTGRYTVTFADETTFWRSHFAAKGWNHPVLLALRYVRLLAADAYHRRTPSAVGVDAIRDRLDEKSMEAAARVFRSSAGDGKLFELSRAEAFHEKLDATIQRAFSGYCDATVASQLHQRFQTTALFRWVGKLRPIHQHLFAKRRDPEALLATWKRYGVDRDRFFLPREQWFPDGLLYHGTRTDEGLRDIAVRGILPSSGGSAGNGLYGTTRKHLENILPSYAGNDEDRIVRFEILPSATIVDVTEGHGREVYERWSRENGSDWSEFCDAFGIDLLRYPYDFPAFVVKNALALGPPRTTLARRSLSDLLEEAAAVRGAGELEALLRAAHANRLDRWEERELVKRTPFVQRFPPANDHRAFTRALAAERLSRETATALVRHLPGSHVASVVDDMVEKSPGLLVARDAVEHLALAMALWGETRDADAIALSVLELAAALQRTYVLASDLPKVLAPLRQLLTAPLDAPVLQASLVPRLLEKERSERKEHRKERRRLLGGYAATLSLATGMFTASAALFFGWDWLLAHPLGLPAWHVGAFASTAMGAGLLAHHKMNGADAEDLLVSVFVAAAGFMVDLPFRWLGVPEYAAGFTASVLGIGGAIFTGWKAWADTRHDLDQATERAEATRDSRERHLSGVLGAVRPKGEDTCATELAKAF